MKHPSTSKEVFEFNLGQALQLRCVHDSRNTICGECESCLITARLNQVKEWFFRAGDESKKRFVLGLVRRLHSVDLLVHLVRLLQPLLCKDFMYARSRTNPSLNTDRCTMSADRAISTSELESQIAASWYWFQTANYWSKWKFMLGVLQHCEAHLLHSIGSQARTLHAAEQNATNPQGKYFPHFFHFHSSLKNLCYCHILYIFALLWGIFYCIDLTMLPEWPLVF